MRRAPCSLLALACLALACNDPSAASGAPRAAAPAPTGGAPTATPGAPATPEAAAPKAEKAKLETPKAPDRALLKHLAAGRKLSREKKYKEAIAAFEQALALHDSDAKVLAELGYAALLDKDLDRSRKASEKALKATTDPKLRASILYNLGRVHEDNGDKPAAAKAYGASLALRDNAEVKRRLDALDEPGAQVDPCSAAFASLDELCGCLKRSEDMLILEGPRTCEPKPLDAKSDRLQVIELGTAEIGTHALQLLVAKDRDGLRMVATLGEIYEPGALGIHNDTELGGVDLRTIAGKTVAVVKYTQNHDDSNLAGLELCSETAKHELLCVLDDVTRCPLAVPVTSESSCGPGIELGPEETDPELIEMANNVEKAAFSRKTTTSYSIDDAGAVTVKLDSGSAEALASGLIGAHSLW